MTKVWLQIARSVGAITFHSLREKYKDPRKIIQELVSRQKQVKTMDLIEKEIEDIGAIGARIVFIDDDEYPVLLKHIRDAPPFLTILGQGKLDNSAACISIVGSRNSSINGNRITSNLAERLVDCGHTIVSGMARGIDRHAHLGGMKSTIAVLGCGIDQVYPPENNDIYEKIREHGHLISEWPIGTPPSTYTFPARNRIIAGMSIGTIVVQASQYSGSLKTAQFAADYGRELFAVPGCPMDPRSYGPNNLIKNGAVLIQDHNDVLRQLDCYQTKFAVHEELGDYAHEVSDDFCNKVLSLISSTPVNIDDLCEGAGLGIDNIRKALVELELQDKIQHLVGDKVVRIA